MYVQFHEKSFDIFSPQKLFIIQVNYNVNGMIVLASN